MDLKLRLNEEEIELFDIARAEYSRIVRRDVSKSEFAVFAMMWFVRGMLRDDVDDDEMESVMPDNWDDWEEYNSCLL